MQSVVADAMAGGAAGFASSASPTHNGDQGRPVPSRVADLAELRQLLEPVRRGGRGVVALLPGGVISHQEVFALQREIGRPFTWTALLTVKDYPYHQKVMAEHDAAWAEGVEVWPQVSCRPLVFQMNLSEPFTLNMRPMFAALMGQSHAERTGGLPRSVLAGAGMGGRERDGGSDPGQLGQHFGGPLGVASRTRRSTAGGPGRGEGLHSARRHAGHLARRRPRDALLVRPGQQRPRGDRLAPAAGQRAARAGRLGCARLPALRCLLRHRPAGELGPWSRGDVARAGRAQAHGRTGGRLRIGRPGHRGGRPGGRPVRLRSRDGRAGTPAPDP